MSKGCRKAAPIACAPRGGRCSPGIIWSAATARRCIARANRSSAGRSARISPGRWRIILFGALSDRTAEPPQILIGEAAWPVRLVPHARERRHRLVLDAARDELRMTLPHRGNRAKALKWAAGQQDWLRAQLGKAVAPVAVGPDAHIPLFGIERRIDWDAARPRAVRLEDDALRLGGPGETRSEEHTSELQSLMRHSYARF